MGGGGLGRRWRGWWVGADFLWWVNYVANRAAAELVVRSIAEAGGLADAVQGDAAREEDVLRLFAAAERQFGAVGGSVNNAAVTGGFARVEAIEAREVERMLAVNVLGTTLCSREAVRKDVCATWGWRWRDREYFSLAARTGGAGEWVHYAASKGAIHSLRLDWRARWRRKGHA